MKKSLTRLLLLPIVLLFANGVLAQTRASTAQPNVTVLPPLAMPGLDRQRSIRLYLPPGYARSTKRYPVLYMHDGQNLFDDATSFVGEWGVDETLNALAGAPKASRLEVIVVGIDHGGDKRLTELVPWDHPRVGKAEGQAYMEFVVKVVKPFIDRNYRTRPAREDTAIMGSSLGGLISQYALYTYPAVFSKAGILSPAYWIADPAYAQAATQVLRRDTRVYFMAGGKEPGKTVENMERMAAMFREKSSLGDNVHVEVVADAEHNEAAWRAAFPKAVSWLFAKTTQREASAGKAHLGNSD